MIAKREWLSEAELKSGKIEHADGPPNLRVTLSWGRITTAYLVYTWSGPAPTSKQPFDTLDAARIQFAIHERELAIGLATHVLDLDQV